MTHFLLLKFYDNAIHTPLKTPMLSIFARHAFAIKFAKETAIAFTADNIYPEGIAWSAEHQTSFVSSLTQGTIGKVSLDSRYTPFIHDDKLISSFGLRVDVARNLLWVAIRDLGSSVRSTPATR